MDGQDRPPAVPRPKIYVSFGPLPTQEMPIEWASAILTAFKAKDPKRFGQYLSDYVTNGN